MQGVVAGRNGEAYCAACHGLRKRRNTLRYSALRADALSRRVLLRLSKYGLEPVTVEQTDHYKVVREFCADQWVIPVNERWRICFEFKKGDVHEVEIVDYHRG